MANGMMYFLILFVVNCKDRDSWINSWMMEQQFQYYAFISYKREDEKWAKWLQDRLRWYKKKVPAGKTARDFCFS